MAARVSGTFERRSRAPANADGMQAAAD